MMFLMIGAACASLATAEFVGAIAILLCLLFSGFMLTQPTLEAKGADWLLWFTFSNPLYQVWFGIRTRRTFCYCFVWVFAQLDPSLNAIML